MNFVFAKNIEISVLASHQMRTSNTILGTFPNAETKGLTPNVKGKKIYLVHSLYKFRFIISWLQGRVDGRQVPQGKTVHGGQKIAKQTRVSHNSFYGLCLLQLALTPFILVSLIPALYYESIPASTF